MDAKEIKKGLDKAYKEAGHNAFFGNGFEAGVKFAESYHQAKSKEEAEDMCKKIEEIVKEFAYMSLGTDWLIAELKAASGKEES